MISTLVWLTVCVSVMVSTLWLAVRVSVTVSTLLLTLADCVSVTYEMTLAYTVCFSVIVLTGQVVEFRVLDGKPVPEDGE